MVFYGFESWWPFDARRRAPLELAKKGVSTVEKLEVIRQIKLLSGQEVSTFVEENCILQLETLSLLPEEVDKLHPSAQFPVSFRSVQVQKRIVVSAFVPNNPPQRALKEWGSAFAALAAHEAAEAEEQAKDPEAAEEVLLSVPKDVKDIPERFEAENRLQKRFDPVRLVYALGHSFYLRTPKVFKESLQSAQDYDNFEPDDDKADLLEQLPRDASKDPSRDSLSRARQLLDPVACLVQRRFFTYWIDLGLIAAVCLYSDASPVVGVELQGMVMDVLLNDNTLHRVVLPGSSMAYGHTDGCAKCIALVWSIWLVVGSTEKNLRYVLSRVRSLTTDYGGELVILLMCDVLPAFLRWVSGMPLEDCRRFVNFNDRLMPRAVRIGGFSHSLGNLMKDACHQFPAYPQYLTFCRALCTFFRSEAIRKHMILLIDAPALNLPVLLKSFTAGFAKWRYETLVDVMTQLMALRELCESHMRKEYFGGLRDQENLQVVLEACAHKAFWRWIVATRTLLMFPLESFRRWSMVCPCHEEERKAGTFKGPCVHDSRRLKGAWAEVQVREAQFLGSANNLDVEEDCEGDVELHTAMVTALRYVAVGLRVRFLYLCSIPWALATCDTVAGAKDCLEQWYAWAADLHDPYTRWFMSMFEGALIHLRDTGECALELAEEVRLLCYASLDESAGEGYHRSTNCERRRCAGAKLAYIKASTRIAANLKLVRGFLDKYRSKARRVVRYEWRNYKRVLKGTFVKRRRVETNVKMKPAAFYARLYRMDEKALENWAPLIDHVEPSSEQAIVETDDDTVRREYYMATFKEGVYYRLAKRVDVVDADRVRKERQDTYFQVLKIHAGKSRTKTIRAVKELHGASRASYSLAVQPLSWLEVDGDTGGQVVYADGDPTWFTPAEMGTFPELSTALEEFRIVMPSASIGGCLVLHDAASAEPQYALMDEKCPVFLIIRELRRRGWKSISDKALKEGRRVEHTRANMALKLCDIRGGVTARFYLQCVLDLPARLALVESIPPRHPQSYYKCLLRDIKVEPGLGDKRYLRLLRGESLLAIEDEAPPPPRAAVEGMEIREVGFAPEPKAPAPRPPASVAVVAPEGLLPIGDEPPVEPKAKGRAKAKPRAKAMVPEPLGADVEIAVIAAPPPAVPKAKAPARLPRNYLDDVIGGGKVVFQDYRPESGPAYPNYILHFTHDGKRYTRKRGVFRDSQLTHGAIEPLAYLHAIRAQIVAGDAPFLENPRQPPTPEQVAAQVEAHRGALSDVVRHFLGPDAL